METNTTFSDCSLAPGDDIPVFGISSNKTAISQDCLDYATNTIATEQPTIGSQSYFIAPGNLECACVQDLDCSS